MKFTANAYKVPARQISADDLKTIYQDDILIDQRIKLAKRINKSDRSSAASITPEYDYTKDAFLEELVILFSRFLEIFANDIHSELVKNINRLLRNVIKVRTNKNERNSIIMHNIKMRLEQIYCKIKTLDPQDQNSISQNGLVSVLERCLPAVSDDLDRLYSRLCTNFNATLFDYLNELITLYSAQHIRTHNPGNEMHIHVHIYFYGYALTKVFGVKFDSLDYYATRGAIGSNSSIDKLFAEYIKQRYTVDVVVNQLSQNIYDSVKQLFNNYQNPAPTITYDELSNGINQIGASYSYSDTQGFITYFARLNDNNEMVLRKQAVMLRTFLLMNLHKDKLVTIDEHSLNSLNSLEENYFAEITNDLEKIFAEFTGLHKFIIDNFRSLAPHIRAIILADYLEYKHSNAEASEIFLDLLKKDRSESSVLLELAIRAKEPNKDLVAWLLSKDNIDATLRTILWSEVIIIPTVFHYQLERLLQLHNGYYEMIFMNGEMQNRIFHTCVISNNKRYIHLQHMARLWPNMLTKMIKNSESVINWKVFDETCCYLSSLKFNEDASALFYLAISETGQKLLAGLLNNTNFIDELNWQQFAKAFCVFVTRGVQKDHSVLSQLMRTDLGSEILTNLLNKKEFTDALVLEQFVAVYVSYIEPQRKITPVLAKVKQTLDNTIIAMLTQSTDFNWEQFTQVLVANSANKDKSALDCLCTSSCGQKVLLILLNNKKISGLNWQQFANNLCSLRNDQHSTNLSTLFLMAEDKTGCELLEELLKNPEFTEKLNWQQFAKAFCVFVTRGVQKDHSVLSQLMRTDLGSKILTDLLNKKEFTDALVLEQFIAVYLYSVPHGIIVRPTNYLLQGPRMPPAYYAPHPYRRRVMQVMGPSSLQEQRFGDRSQDPIIENMLQKSADFNWERFAQALLANSANKDKSALDCLCTGRSCGQKVLLILLKDKNISGLNWQQFANNLCSLRNDQHSTNLSTLFRLAENITGCELLEELLKNPEFTEKLDWQQFAKAFCVFVTRGDQKKRSVLSQLMRTDLGGKILTNLLNKKEFTDALVLEEFIAVYVSAVYVPYIQPQIKTLDNTIIAMLTQSTDFNWERFAQFLPIHEDALLLFANNKNNLKILLSILKQNKVTGIEQIAHDLCDHCEQARQNENALALLSETDIGVDVLSSLLENEKFKNALDWKKFTQALHTLQNNKDPYSVLNMLSRSDKGRGILDALAKNSEFIANANKQQIIKNEIEVFLYGNYNTTLTPKMDQSDPLDLEMTLQDIILNFEVKHALFYACYENPTLFKKLLENKAFIESPKFSRAICTIISRGYFKNVSPLFSMYRHHSEQFEKLLKNKQFTASLEFKKAACSVIPRDDYKGESILYHLSQKYLELFKTLLQDTDFTSSSEFKNAICAIIDEGENKGESILYHLSQNHLELFKTLLQDTNFTSSSKFKKAICAVIDSGENKGRSILAILPEHDHELFVKLTTNTKFTSSSEYRIAKEHITPTQLLECYVSIRDGQITPIYSDLRECAFGQYLIDLFPAQGTSPLEPHLTDNNKLGFLQKLLPSAIACGALPLFQQDNSFTKYFPEEQIIALLTTEENWNALSDAKHFLFTSLLVNARFQNSLQNFLQKNTERSEMVIKIIINYYLQKIRKAKHKDVAILIENLYQNCSLEAQERIKAHLDQKSSNDENRKQLLMNMLIDSSNSVRTKRKAATLRPADNGFFKRQKKEKQNMKTHKRKIHEQESNLQEIKKPRLE